MQSLVSSSWSTTPRMLGTVRDRPSATPYMNELAGLPTELLLSTTDFLPVDDWICLSLCNRRLFAIYHRRYNSTKLSREMRLSVLGRLERDRPQYFICYTCLILHKYDGSEFFGLSGPSTHQSCPLPCFSDIPVGLTLRREYDYPFRVLRTFQFLDIQLVMRRFYLGDPFGTSIEALSYTQVRVQPEISPCPEITSIFSTDAQICSEQPALYFRIQQVMVAPISKSQLLLYISSDTYDLGPQQDMFICMHMQFHREDKAVNPVVLAYHNGEKNPGSNFNCHYCNTDARIEIREHGSYVALILTTWINLGSGLTPDDRRWKIHSHGNLLMRCNSTELKDTPRVSFENASPLSLEALLLRNLSYIKDKRYRQIMQPLSRHHWNGRGVWYLPSIPSSPSSSSIPSSPSSPSIPSSPSSPSIPSSPSSSSIPSIPSSPSIPSLPSSPSLPSEPEEISSRASCWSQLLWFLPT
ncbi:hypothetical protein N7457_008160 [Penicillium paradoxum]|uniref:uncharacterized protein n=1 Tax=Penicillium paradoxum TaxID=176176 RepID=UPI002546BC35|nr:uncharacterized protein N7457_008160 [Penicillium paradoxum]KAJ5773264.1 hypothetical protein N7457_008160 [Penicillium paradoxum]